MYLLSAIALVFATAAGATEVPAEGEEVSVSRWHRFELTIVNPTSYGNPFTDVALDAVFISPSGERIEWFGFYDGDNTWKIRFMPTEVGTWRYEAKFSDGSGARSGAFECVKGDLHGPLRVRKDNPLWFEYADGTPFYMRSFHLWQVDALEEEILKKTLDFMKAQGFNTIYGPHLGEGRLPWGRKPDGQLDFSRFNLQLWQNLDRVLRMAAERGIVLIPFNIIGGTNGMPKIPTKEQEDLFLRYWVARWGGFWNATFQPTSEWEEGFWESEILRIGQRLQELDRGQHLISVHSWKESTDSIRRASWYSYHTVQDKLCDWNPMKFSRLIDLYLHVKKPILVQESLWEGNGYQGEAGLDIDNLRRAAWVIALFGGQINYDDSVPSPRRVLGFGEQGVKTFDVYGMEMEPQGLFYPHLKVLGDMFESIPFWRMIPQPRLSNTGVCLAQIGEEYLVYAPYGGALILDLTGVEGDFVARWLNPRNGQFGEEMDVGGGGKCKFISPDENDWVLHVKRIHPDIGENFLMENGGICYLLIPSRAGRVLRFGANELARYLREMAGIQVHIVEDELSKGERPLVSLKVREGLPEEGFSIRVGEGFVEIRGGSERAVLYGIYDLLETLGCRWLCPGEDFVPRLDRISLPAGEKESHPALAYRIMHFADTDMPVELLDWMAKRRMNVLFPHLNYFHGWAAGGFPHFKVEELVSLYFGDPSLMAYFPPYDLEQVKDRGIIIMTGGHCMPDLLPPEKYYDEHPEYYPMINGKRERPGLAWQPCMSNPEVVEVLASNIVAFLKAHPEVEIFSLWFNDSGGWCECPSCKALQPEGGPDRSPTFLQFCRKVMERVKRELPHIRFETGLGYEHRHAPEPQSEFQPLPDTLFYIDYYQQCQRHPLSAPCNVQEMERLCEDWGRFYPLNKTYVWVYYGDQCKTPDLPLGLVHRAVEDVRWAKSKGLAGINCLNVVAPIWYLWTLHHLNFYALSKAAWDPSVEPKDLIVDFCVHYYGRSWEPMVRYYELLEEATDRVLPEQEKWVKPHAHAFHAPQAYLSRDMLAKMRDCVEKALALSDNEAIRGRIERAAETVKLLELLWEAGENPAPPRAKEIAEGIRRIARIQTWPKQALRRARPERRARDLLKKAEGE